MSGATSKQLVRATHAIAENMGIRYCNKCNQTRSVEGGKTKIVSDGRTRWECATCAAKLRKPGINKRT